MCIISLSSHSRIRMPLLVNCAIKYLGTCESLECRNFLFRCTTDFNRASLLHRRRVLLAAPVPEATNAAGPRNYFQQWRSRTEVPVGGNATSLDRFQGPCPRTVATRKRRRCGRSLRATMQLIREMHQSALRSTNGGRVTTTAGSDAAVAAGGGRVRQEENPVCEYLYAE